MPGFKTRNVKVTLGGDSYLLRVLCDKQQLSDVEGHSKPSYFLRAMGLVRPALHYSRNMMGAAT